MLLLSMKRQGFEQLFEKLLNMVRIRKRNWNRNFSGVGTETRNKLLRFHNTASKEVQEWYLQGEQEWYRYLTRAYTEMLPARENRSGTCKGVHKWCLH